jgi:polyhydroxybutyrate depolymerase
MARWRAGRIGLLLLPLLLLGACSGAQPMPPHPGPVPARTSQSTPTAKAAVSAGASTVQRELTVGGVRRSYLAVGVPGKQGLPLVIVLHGRGVTAQQESVRTGFLTYADSGLADLVYPQGTYESWNDGHGCCGKAGASGIDDLGFVTQLVGDATRFFGSNPKHVYMVGYSNGARLAFEEVCGNPSLFAAFATYGALPPTTCAGGPPMRVLIGGGTNDTLMHGEGSVTTTLTRWRQRDGCASASTTAHTGPLTMTTWAACRDRSTVVYAAYSGTGHHWPTAEPNPEPFTTPVGSEAAAATVMWDFLVSHSA